MAKRERNGETDMKLIWQEENKRAILYEVYSDSPEIFLPEEIEDRELGAVGAYCFSDRGPSGGTDERMFTVIGEDTSHPAQGEFVEKICLPDTVRCVENAAFFNCRKLAYLEVGRHIEEIGSDVFNNCNRLHQIRIRGSAGEDTSAKAILARISWGVEVAFDDAVVYYPEYYEGYDTIEPAHIFGLNIEGEGFRARQCFREGKVDFEAYDAVFEKACAEESPEVLTKMALNRLTTPFGLGDTARKRYEDYILRNQEKIVSLCVEKCEAEWLAFVSTNMLKGERIEEKTLEQGLVKATRKNWTEGVALLLAARQGMTQQEATKQNGGGKEKNRYEFE